MAAQISVKPDKTENCLEAFVSPTAVIKTPAMSIAISNEISDSLLSRIMKEAAELTEEQYHYLMLGLNPLKPKIKEVHPRKLY